MPSPFPGMDPYLENPDFWQGFHNSLMTYTRDTLQPALPANYIATLEMRIYIEEDPGSGERVRSRVPDREVVRTGPSSSWVQPARRQEVALRGHVMELDPIEYREAYVVIRSVPAGELITSIELLSPTNKRPGEGRDQYRVKQNEMFVAGVNIIEIDLLRRRAHTVLPPAYRVAQLPPFHYLTSIYRISDALKCQVLTWTVREPLPTIPIPLAPEDQELDLDLPVLFNQAYDNGAFRRLLDYKREPDPPLAGEDAEWADALLREVGLRGNSVA
jgi:uncharacterized protein DUF4058